MRVRWSSDMCFHRRDGVRVVSDISCYSNHMLQQRARRVLWCASWLVLAVGVPARAQTPPTLDTIARRLEQMDRENAVLRAELQALRSEIERLTREQASVDEQAALQAGRISEQEQVKAQTTQRVPV